MKRKVMKRSSLQLHTDLIAAFTLISGHALAMAGKTARINDKSDPIIRTCDAMLARLGAPVAKPVATRADGLDIGQGDGCESGKCTVPR